MSHPLRMRTFVLSVALLAGCYYAPPSMTAERVAAARARADYYRQEQAEAAENAETERACATTSDVSAKISCAEWRLALQNLEIARQRQLADRERAADESTYRQAEAARVRRQRIADAIQAGADAYARAQPRNCTSTLMGNQVSTTCY